MDRIREVDAGLRRVSDPFVEREAAIGSPTWFAQWSSMEAFALAGLSAVDAWRRDYSWLYSRAHFAASHLLAAAYKLAHPEVVWSAEFSDPLSRDVHGAVRGTDVRPGPLRDRLRKGMRAAGLPMPASPNCLVWAEELTYALADELLFTNANQLELMLGYCTNPDVADAARRKAVISPHPTPPPHLYAMSEVDHPRDPDAVNLAYFGDFYPNRGLDDVLRALAAAPPTARARLRLHVFTRKPAEPRRRAAELGLDGHVVLAPFVGYLDFLRLTTMFDCLVVNDATTAGGHPVNPYLPSKLSDYLGSGTPVWGIAEAGSALSEQPLHVRTPVGDVEAARDVLVRFAADGVPRAG
jgi:hypothetical protein